MTPSSTAYEWRGRFDDRELDDLHAAAFGYEPVGWGWNSQFASQSLGWLTAREDGQLVGFVNVAWDGGAHAFLLDLIVEPDHQRREVGRTVVGRATDGARAAGCDWLHVDFEEPLSKFYIERCGFRPTAAGLIRL